MKFLIVDDSMTARLIGRKTFESLGHTVLEASDGQEALTVLATQSPIDVIILDWNMPGMNGFTCLENIRKISALNRTKVVMCTTEAEKMSVIKALQAGANGYLLKPVLPDKLKQGVEKALGTSLS